jgi:hypothetical protein
VVYKANVRFVDKCRGLKRVSGTLAAKIDVRQAVKLIVNEREQLLPRLTIAVTPVAKKLRYLLNIVHPTQPKLSLFKMCESTGLYNRFRDTRFFFGMDVFFETHSSQISLACLTGRV